MALVKFCLRDTAGSPERARCLHLARSGSQSQRAIWFILPAREASDIINTSYGTLSSGILWNIPRLYYEKGLHNYFIPGIL